MRIKVNPNNLNRINLSGDRVDKIIHGFTLGPYNYSDMSARINGKIFAMNPCSRLLVRSATNPSKNEKPAE